MQDQFRTNIQFDILRIAAAFAVVCVHVSADVAVNPNDTLLQWWMGNIGEVIGRWAVPVFVMVSGALLLGERKSFTPKEFYVRRAGRILVPLIFWTIVYLIFRRLRSHTGGTALLTDTIKGVPYGHLWFLYMLMGLYAVTPLLRSFVAANSQATITATGA